MSDDMQSDPAPTRGSWGGRIGFILAATGSAVGLGNIWKFPYITGENGGGLFVLIYLACIALVGLPILIAEIMIGRAAQAQPVEAFKRLQGGPTAWASVGWLGVVAGFLIASFYIVVAGWSMDYTLKSVAGFTNPIAEKAEDSALKYRVFTDLSEMRLDLAIDESRLDVAAAEKAWRKQFSPSVWASWSEFTSHQDLEEDGHPSKEARARLMLDPEIAAAVKAVEPKLPELQAKISQLQTDAANRVAAMDDADVVNSATAIARRGSIRAQVESKFSLLATDGWTSTYWAAIFMFLAIVVVASGVGKGIERTCRVLMPLLIGCMVFLTLYGMFQPGFGRAVSFVFAPDATALEPKGVLEALGHAFFTLSLGMGAMLTYGSYQRSGSGGLLGESVSIAGLDTGIALLACLMMFPIIFSYGQDPSGGPGLVFMSMPLAFVEMGQLGMLLGIVFFGLLFFAALTSAISLLEVVASYFIDAKGWGRHKAAWIMGSAIFGFGIITAFSNSAGFKMSSWLPGYGQSYFDTMDVLTSNWMLPLGGLLIAIYAGWIMPARLRNAELSDFSGPLAASWLVLVRYVAPVLVTIVLLDKIGVVNVNELYFNMTH
ncbi:MAG: sodium-dependent transporter [Phycisphaerales bacterium]|nr:sodium-dependent transporter [Phycisphaerales bacterium]